MKGHVILNQGDVGIVRGVYGVVGSGDVILCRMRLCDTSSTTSLIRQNRADSLVIQDGLSIEQSTKITFPGYWIAMAQLGAEGLLKLALVHHGLEDKNDLSTEV